MHRKIRKNLLPHGKTNDAFVLLSSSSGRTVGFIVGLNSRGVAFDHTPAGKYTERHNLLDMLLDASFLPFDDTEPGEEMEIDDLFYSPYSFENKLRRSLQIKRLSDMQLSELEDFMQHIPMTEN